MTDHAEHLVFGSRPDLPDIAAWPTFPFEGEMRVKPIEAPELPELPEPPRGRRARPDDLPRRARVPVARRHRPHA